jgi:hypothetical protein
MYDQQITPDGSDEAIPKRHSPAIARLARHLAWHGVGALAVAVAYLVLLRGLELRIIVMFGIPPTCAVLFTAARFPRATRRVAWAFLTAVGIGALVAPFPILFPRLRGFEGQLPPWQDRMLTWYACVYIIWGVIVLPLYGFCGSLRAHRLGQPARLSRPTCYLGIFTVTLFCLALPGLFVLVGFWPVF